MITHAINKQVFELNCSDEQTAMELQKQLLYHVGPAMEAIITAVLDEVAGNGVLIQVDRLQIDLGDLRPAEFGSAELLQRFTKLLQEQCASLLHPDEEVVLSKALTLRDAECEMAGLFLLSGDLPWWADKSMLPDMDMLLRKLIKEIPGWVRAFLDNKPAWSPVWKRLRWQCKPATLRMLSAVLRVLPEALGVLPETLGVSPVLRVRSEALSKGPEGQGEVRGAGDQQGRRLLRGDKEAHGGELMPEGLPMADGEDMQEPMIRKGSTPEGVRGSGPGVEDESRPGSGPMAEGALGAGSESGPESIAGNVPMVEREPGLGPESMTESGSMGGRESMAGGEREMLLQRGRSMQGAKGPQMPQVLQVPQGPGKMRADANNSSATVEMEARLPTLIRSFFKKKSQYGAVYRTWAVNRLLRVLFNGGSANGLIFLLRSTGWIGNTTLLLLESLRSATTGDRKEIRAQIRQELERLSTLQLTLLLYDIKMGLTKSEEGPPAEVAALEKSDHPEKQALVLTLMEQFGEQAGPLYELLLRWPDTALLSLRRKWGRQLRTQKKLDQMKERLLRVETNEPEEADRQDIPEERIGAFVLPALAVDGLTDTEMDLLEDMLCKRPFDTLYKKRMATRLLRKLPDGLIRLLDHFTRLGATEWTELLPPASPITTIMDSQQKMDTSERTLIENAGLCLFAPYLPSLFGNLDYLSNNRFKSRTHAYKAVYLLHYIWTGKRKAPEYLLSINKLFCGIPLEAPIPGKVRLGKRELEEADQLIQSVIANWTALRSTSAEGLRGSFLCRKGMIRDLGSHMVLQVERKDYDILLNGVSWGYSIIKLPWMKKYMQVEW